MSWSISFTGTRDGATKATAEQFDKLAASYEGKEEGKDILAIKERIVSLIAATDLSVDGSVDWNAVTVTASGSHSWNAKGIQSANFSLQVTRVSLKL
jgi:hypothetical protein